MYSYRTNSLFHYTRKTVSLLQIIKSGSLYPNYCMEDLSTKTNPNFTLGIPQICFCDIPLSRSMLFQNQYGKYAIGFSKCWGIDKGANPIHYINNDSIIDGIIFYRQIWKKYHDIVNVNNDFGKQIDLFFKTLNANKAKDYTLGFVKKYNGEWKGKVYCNYDENEWRYVLEEGFHDIFWHSTVDEYKEWRGPISKSKPKPTYEMKQLGMKFSINDINHIILNYESQIPKFISSLRKIHAIGNNVLTSEDMDLLISKVTSFEKIAKDY